MSWHGSYEVTHIPVFNDKVTFDLGARTNLVLRRPSFYICVTSPRNSFGANCDPPRPSVSARALARSLERLAFSSHRFSARGKVARAYARGKEEASTRTAAHCCF